MKKQLDIFSYHQATGIQRKYGRTCHGGARTRGARKEQRPLASGAWIHLVLKSAKAKGAWSFLTPRNKILVERILREKARRWGIKIADFANVGNHLHIKCRFSHRENFQNFLRSVSCLIARKITGARRGKKLSSGFWQGLAFTRVLKTSYEELQLRGYFSANRIQARRGEKTRKEFLDKFNRWIYRLKYLSP